MSELHDERAELAEDEEKLQIALQEYGSEWLTEVEDDDEEDCLLIDLDGPLSSSDESEGRSLSPSFTGSGSRILALNYNEEESQDVLTAPELPPEASKEAEASESEKTLALNRALQGILEKHMEDIRVALEENKMKQQRLDDGKWNQEALDDSKGRTFGPFRSPYFQHGVSVPPPNEDVRLKKRTGELLYEEMRERLSLSVRNREILMEGVLDDLREQAMKPHMTKFEVEVKKAKELDLAIEEIEIGVAQARTKMIAQQHKIHIQKKAGRAMGSLEKEVKKLGHEVKRLQQTLSEKKLEKERQAEIMAALEDEMDKIKMKNKKSLMVGFDIDSVDWMKISKKYFEDKTSWVDCRKAWEHVMNPSLNQGHWSKTEEKYLKELVKKNPAGSWDVVAKTLGTRRSAFMCFHRYQRCINPAFKSRPWTPEEDRHLLAVMKGMKDGASFFSWRKVSALIESRSAAECMYRHTKLDEDLNHGKWKAEEDARLLAAVEIMGKSWAKISRYIRHRTATQCRDRYTQSLDPGLNFSFFTYDEDKKILQLRREGMSWCKMIHHFRGRSDNMIICRNNTLQNWKKEEAWWQTQTPETQELLRGKYLSMSERKSEEGESSKFYSLRLGIGKEDYERQQSDRDKGVPEDLIPPRPPFHLKYTKFSRLRRSLSARRWTDRVTFHSYLKENLSNLMAKESGKVTEQMPKEEEETEEEKRTIMKLINTSATQTLKGCNSTKQSHQEMLNTLNRHFLGDAHVSVRELLQTAKKKGSPKKASMTGWRVNSELNKILRNNNRAYLKRGRIRKALPRDGRSREKIESETQEVKRSIPVLMLELLGPGFSNIHNLVKHKRLDLEAERIQVESFKDDVDYKSRVEMLESCIEEFHHQPFLMPSQRDKEIARVRKKLTKLQRIFKSHYHERKKKFDCVLELLNHDVEYINSLKNMETELPNDYLSKASRVKPSPVAATQLMSSPQTSAALMLLSSENKAPEAAQSNGVEEKRKPLRASLRRNQAVNSSLRKRKEPESEQRSLSAKKPRYKSLEQLENDRKKLPTWVKTSVTDLPYLPPTSSTLKALRALLLNRQELVKTAGVLYDVENYRKRTQPPFEVVRGCIGMKEEANSHSVDSSMDNASAERESDQVYPRCFPELDNARKELDCYLKELGLERTTRKGSSVTCGVSQNSVIPSSTPSMSAVAGNQITSVSQNLQYLGSTHLSDLKLKQKVQQLIPTPKDSKYEVTYGITAHSRCYGHMEKESKKLSVDINDPAKTTLPSSSASTPKVLSLPKVSNQNCPILVCPSSRGRFYRVQPRPSLSGPPPNPSGTCPKLPDSMHDSKKSSLSATGESLETVHSTPVNKGKPPGTDVVTGPTFSTLLKKTLPKSPDLGKVVMVGLDPKTKKVVHFTPSPGTDVFKPVQKTNCQDRESSKETVSTKEPESEAVIVKQDPLTVDRNKGDKKPQPEIIATEKVDPNIIQAIKQTDEYKNFSARLRSLFMWPVLMSTIAPPEAPDPTPERKAAKPQGNPKGKTKRKFLSKELRQLWKRQAAERKEARLQADREKAAENPALENIKDETKVPQKKRGRKQKGLSSNHPLLVAPRAERPVRMVRRKQQTMKAVLEPPPPAYRSLPGWWKEAMVEAMVVQKAIEDGKMLPDVKNLSEDEDFQDKGNYTDDDGWLASLLEEERKEKERTGLLKRVLGGRTGEEEEERMGRVKKGLGGRMGEKAQEEEEEEEERIERIKEALRERMEEEKQEEEEDGEEDRLGQVKEVPGKMMEEEAEEEGEEERLGQMKEALGERMEEEAEEEGEEERLGQVKGALGERMEEEAEEEGEEDRLGQVKEVPGKMMEEEAEEEGEEERLGQMKEALGERMEEEAEEEGEEERLGQVKGALGERMEEEAE